jgi:hypothetical protein
MRWLAIGMVLLTALVIVIALMIGDEGKETKRAPRVRPEAPPQSLVIPLRTDRLLGV